jgi:D-Tyr-tRNAtyr deacylase
VKVKGEVIASISKRLLTLFGAEKNDDEDKVKFLAENKRRICVAEDLL